MSTHTHTPRDDAQPPQASETLRQFLGDNGELAVLDALIEFETGATYEQLCIVVNVNPDLLETALEGLERSGLVRAYHTAGDTYWTLDESHDIAKHIVGLWKACRQEGQR